MNKCIAAAAYLVLLCGINASPSPTTAPSRDLSQVTPNLDMLMAVSSTVDMRSDKEVAQIASFQWSLPGDDASTRIPFMMCSDGNRASVERLQFHLETMTPLVSDRNLTCFISSATREHVLDLVSTLPSLKFAMPLSGTMKLSNGFLDTVVSDAFIGNSCTEGIAVTTAADIDVEILQDRVRSDLSTGAYLQSLRTRFYWTSEPSSSGNNNKSHMDVYTPSVDSGSRRLLMDRGQHWRDHIAPVLSGDEVCDFESMEMTGYDSGGDDISYMSLQQVCAVSTNCTVALLAYLTTLSEVMFIEPSPVIVVSNWDSGGIAQSGTTTFTPLWTAGLKGRGQVVGVSDTGLDVNNCYFRQTPGKRGGGVTDPSVFSSWQIGSFNNRQRKVVQYLLGMDNTDKHGHGTHVCGTIAGYIEGSAIGGTNNYNGVAPDAKISFFDFENADGAMSFPTPIDRTMYRPQMRAGVRIFSQSWTTNAGYKSKYDMMSNIMDRFMYRFPQTLILQSAGNYGHNIGDYSTNVPTKNVLMVGASRTDSTYPKLSVAYFSSVGPTVDGRIKPDLIAPGTAIYSAKTQTSCDTGRRQGTSMSCPLVSGLALLLRQYFMEGWYPTGVKSSADRFVPSGALIKAMLINSCVPVEKYVNLTSTIKLGPPPDKYQGFGQVQINRVLKLGTAASQPSLFVVDSRETMTGEVHTYKFTVRSN